MSAFKGHHPNQLNDTAVKFGAASRIRTKHRSLQGSAPAPTDTRGLLHQYNSGKRNGRKIRTVASLNDTFSFSICSRVTPSPHRSMPTLKRNQWSANSLAMSIHRSFVFRRMESWRSPSAIMIAPWRPPTSRPAKFPTFDLASARLRATSLHSSS